MKGCWLALFIMFLSIHSSGQVPISVVEGIMEVYHSMDTTSIYIGKQSGQNANPSFEHSNTFIGTNAGRFDVDGYNNSFFGYRSGYNNIDGRSNSFYGRASGILNTSGDRNTFTGERAGFFNNTGKDNTYVGSQSGYLNESGSYNTYIGSAAGGQHVSGHYNSSLGYSAGTSVVDSFYYATTIGANSTVSTDSTIILGRPEDGVVAPGHLVVSQDIPAVHHPDVRLMVMDNSNPTLSIRASDNSTPKIQLTKDPTNANSDWTIRMNVPGDDELQFRHHGNTRLEISPNGPVKINTLGAAGSTDLCQNASNQISSCSSSVRYKKEVKNYNAGLEIINQLRPVSYLWKESDDADVGFIAEEIAQIDERFITRNQKNQIEGVKYDRMIIILANAIKEQQKMIKNQNEQILLLKEYMKKLLNRELN